MAAERAAAAWSQGDVTGIFVETRRYRDELETYDRDLDLGIFAAGHRELAAAAPDSVLYKPCGAGGGDIGIALSPDSAALRAFGRTASVHGFRRVPLVLDGHGAGAVKNDG
jgi:phosphomevalonate kinase